MKVYIFDLDGTLANLDHRLHFIQRDKPDWRGFFSAVGEDGVYQHIARLARSLDPIIVASGRSDECRVATESWLDLNDLWPLEVYMRKEGDHRPDYQVKKDMLAMIIADGYEPIMAFDDRNQVVEMWRENGVPCAQVAAGDF